MTRKWRLLLEKLETENQNRKNWEEEHPPITRISVQEADERRRLTKIGENAVTCDLPCHGPYIPPTYSRTGNMVNIYNRGLKVEGYSDPEEGVSCYFGITCELANGKICVATDPTLRKSIERG